MRYGNPLTAEQIAFAIEHYRLAILQPWETDALEQIKAARPDMTVLCYKCLSSTRDYEPGPIFSSGVSYREAAQSAPHWFARRTDGSRIEWNTYPGHWQMAVWDAGYRARWCELVSSELENTLWDGVMADNDVFDDYYGIAPPIDGARTMEDIRRALDGFVSEAGYALSGSARFSFQTSLSPDASQDVGHAMRVSVAGTKRYGWRGGPTSTSIHRTRSHRLKRWPVRASQLCVSQPTETTTIRISRTALRRFGFSAVATTAPTRPLATMTIRSPRLFLNCVGIRRARREAAPSRERPVTALHAGVGRGQL